jgi:hypothetical protein
MPNGGSDCCGTCWFNASNEGEAGYRLSRGPRPPAFCLIRSFTIESPYYTYCANHPYRRPERDSTPIGPVFTGDSSGARELYLSSPDTEEVRQHLLALLAAMEEQPASEYPAGTYLDEMVVWQLGEFREQRATDGLRRVAGFNPSAAETGPFRRTRKGLVRLAREAIARTRVAEPGQALHPDMAAVS